MKKILAFVVFVLACDAYAGGAVAVPVEPVRGLAVCYQREPRFSTCVKQERIPWEAVGAFMEKTGKRTFEDEEIILFYEGWKAANTVKEEK